MKQCALTPAAGKRLIGKALVSHPSIEDVLSQGTLVIIAGTTNGYVAEEILKSIGKGDGFDRKHFVRGITLPPSKPTTESGRMPDESKFPGDVIIKDGKWIKGKTIFDVVGDLKSGDVIIKGANAVNLENGECAVLVGHPQGGTIGAAYQAVVGRRVELIVPVGLEKRIDGCIPELAAKINLPGSTGPRLFALPTVAFTELDALSLLCGVTAELTAAGGVGGAEGTVWLGIEGEEAEVERAAKLIGSIKNEPAFI